MPRAATASASGYGSRPRPAPRPGKCSSAANSADIADLIDGSWLLRCELFGGTEVSVGGRRAFRVRVVPPHRKASSLVVFCFPAVALVDAETGRLLRLTSYGGGKPMARHELRDVTFGPSGDFGFEPPPGLRVVEEAVRNAKNTRLSSALSGKLFFPRRFYAPIR
jgi:hypothetical protein